MKDIKSLVLKTTCSGYSLVAKNDYTKKIIKFTPKEMFILKSELHKFINYNIVHNKLFYNTITAAELLSSELLSFATTSYLEEAQKENKFKYHLQVKDIEFMILVLMNFQQNNYSLKTILKLENILYY